MSSSTIATTPVIETVREPILRLRPATIHRGVLAQISFCVVPAMVAVGFGAVTAGAYWVYVWVLALLAYDFATKKGPEALSLIIGATPAMMLLRGSFYYSAFIVILGLGIFIQLVWSREDFAKLRAHRTLVALLLFALIYWWISFLRTGEYSSNIRMFELAFAAANVYLLSRHRALLATALIGTGIAALAVACGLMPYGDRLGLAEIDDMALGNPITLGLPTALAFLLTIAEGGKWLLLERKGFWRVLFSGLLAASLAMSTSRGSWLVTFVGLVLIAFFNRRARKVLLGTSVIAVIGLMVVMQTERGSIIKHYFDNATSSDKSIEKRTTGRAEQWEAFPQIFADSPPWGFGPGSGTSVSKMYTKEGKPFHSLYLLIGAEAGLIGLSLLACLLSLLISRGLIHWQFCGEIVPLIGILCFMTIGVSVSAVDANSGIYLGLAFLAQDYSSMVTARQVVAVRIVPG